MPLQLFTRYLRAAARDGPRAERASRPAFIVSFERERHSEFFFRAAGSLEAERIRTERLLVRRIFCAAAALGDRSRRPLEFKTRDLFNHSRRADAGYRVGRRNSCRRGRVVEGRRRLAAIMRRPKTGSSLPSAAGLLLLASSNYFRPPFANEQNFKTRRLAKGTQYFEAQPRRMPSLIFTTTSACLSRPLLTPSVFRQRLYYHSPIIWRNSGTLPRIYRSTEFFSASLTFQ